MDEQKECDITRNHVPQRPSTVKEFGQQYRLMNIERYHINKELTQQKAHERKIYQKLRWFSDLDMKIKWKMWYLKYLENDQGKFEHSLSDSVQKTKGFLRLPGNDDPTPVRPDKKRCKKRLIKKGRVDIEYLEEVQEEYLSLMKSSERTYCGTLELNDMIEIMVQRIQHGNKKRSDEMKIFQELSNLKKTKESYIRPEPHPDSDPRERISKRDTDQKRDRQHQIKILLDDIDSLKREQIQIRSKERVRRLKSELEHVRKRFIPLDKKLENVDLKIHELKIKLKRELAYSKSIPLGLFINCLM